MKTALKICEKCLRIVRLNGAGSTSNFWNRGVTWTINKLYPITQELFFEASCAHDMRYHQGPWSDDAEKDRLFCDNEFHGNCRIAVFDSNKWLVKTFQKWFLWQAEKYYLAVRLGGSASFEKIACTCRDK